ncbi:MAG: hypothetical protein AMXMBFR64_18350 [Myxococcales bacterium]
MRSHLVGLLLVSLATAALAQPAPDALPQRAEEATAPTPSALPLKDAVKALAKPGTRDLGLQSLPAHGADGLKALAAWWKRGRKDAVVGEQTARTALAFGGAAEGLLKELLKSPTHEPSLADTVVRLEPEEASSRLVPLAGAALKDDAARARVVRLIGERRLSGATNVALDALRTGGPRTRDAAARSLGELPRQDFATPIMLALREELNRASAENLPARRSMLWALGEIGSTEVVAPLVEALSRDDQRAVAVDSLIKVGEPAVSPLSLIVKTGDMARLGGAVQALRGLGTRATPHLVDALRFKKPEVAALVRDLLIAADDPTIVRAVADLVVSGKLDAPQDALKILAQHPGPEIVPAFQAMMGSRVQKLREDAIEQVAAVAAGELVPALLDIAERDAEPSVRVRAVVALHRMGASAALPLLEKMAQYEDAQVRVVALRALADLGAPAQVPAIAAALQMNNEEVRSAARHTLSRLSGESGERSASGWADWVASMAQRVERRALTKTETSREGTVDVGGARLRWRSLGEGHPLVVLHDGPGFDSAVLVPDLDPLASDLRLITYDRRGVGPDGSIAQLDGFTPETDLADLEALRSSLGLDKMDLLGHGFGGVVALAYLRAHPERVRRVVLMSTGVPASQGAARLGAAEQRLAEPWRGDLAALRAEGWRYDPAALQAYTGRLLLPAFLAATSWLPLIEVEARPDLAAAARISAAWGDYDLRDVLRGASAPLLMLVGSTGLPASEVSELKELARANPRLSLRTIDDAGHWPFVEQPGATVSAIAKHLED